MNDDYLINLLPSEYLPKPEFKGFPIFLIGVLALVAMFLAADYTRVNNKLNFLEEEKEIQQALVKKRTPLAMEALDVQARSRMLFSYGVSIWSMMHQIPPWVEVYNEIEESIPKDMWIESLTLVGGGEKKWPGFTLVGLVAGNQPNSVMDFYELMLDPDCKFEKVKISGYTFVKYDKMDAVRFNMRFSIKKTGFSGF